MKCIIGLGNPGDRYIKTKHNFGFWVIDSYLKNKDIKLKLGKGDYVFTKYDDTLFVKPTTFMNHSGLSVKNIVEYFNIDIQDVIIVYDDIDLPLGSIRFKIGGSSGGHRGLDSIIYHLQNENFLRLKLGIGTDSEMRPSESYVLKPFPLKYQNKIDETIKKACEGLEFLIANSINETMNKYNRKIIGEN